MTKKIILLLVFGTSFCFGQDKVDTSEVRHLIGIKKDFDRGIRAEYLYKLKNRWRIGLGGSYSLRDKTEYAPDVPPIQGVRLSSALFALGAYDIIMRDYFILRGAAYFGAAHVESFTNSKSLNSTWSGTYTSANAVLEALAPIGKHYEVGASVIYETVFTNTRIPVLYVTVNFKF